MRFNSSIIGPKQTVSVITGSGMFSLAEQQQLEGANSWPQVLEPAIYSIYFDGSGDYLTVPTSTSLSLDADFTIDCWVYLTSAPADYQMILSSSDGNNYLSIRSTAIELIGLSGVVQISFNNLLTANLWHYLAITRSGSTVNVWLDGKSLGSSGSKTGSLNLGSASLSTYVGRWGAALQYYFPGYISNLRVVKGQSLYSSTFALPITNSPIALNTSLLLGTSTTLTDASTYNHTITPTGDVAVNTTYGPNISASISFDGTGDYITAPNATSLQMESGDFTIEFFIRFSSISGLQTPYSKGYTAAGDLLIQTGNGNGRLVIYASGSAIITETGTASTNTWIHYALVRSGSTVTLYRDGVSSGSATSTVNFNTTDQLGIGAAGKAPPSGSVGDYAVNGYMSNLRVVKGVAIYTSGFTPPSSDLTNVSGTSLLIGQFQAFLLDFSSQAQTLSKFGNTTYSTAVYPF